MRIFSNASSQKFTQLSKKSLRWIVGAGMIGCSASYYFKTQCDGSRPRETVVIVGGGIAGTRVATNVGQYSRFNIIVVDPGDAMTYSPLLPYFATSILAQHHVSYLYSTLFAHHPTIRHLRSIVTNIDFDAQTVTLDHDKKNSIRYDWVIAATGSRTNYFANPEFEAVAPGLKSIADAKKIRAIIKHAKEQEKPITIIGAGPTGVELACLIKSIGVPTRLIDGQKSILPLSQPIISEKALHKLEERGIPVETNKLVRDRAALLAFDFVIWTAGVVANSGLLPAAYLDKRKCAAVGEDLVLHGKPNAFAIGDLSPHTPTAQVANQAADYVSKIITNGILSADRKPFKPCSRAELLSMTNGEGIGMILGIAVSGLFPFIAKNIVLSSRLPGSFSNRTEVFFRLMRGTPMGDEADHATSKSLECGS